MVFSSSHIQLQECMFGVDLTRERLTKIEGQRIEDICKGVIMIIYVEFKQNKEGGAWSG